MDIQRLAPALALAALASAPAYAHAQSVVVDEGTFAISVRGEEVGSEEFTIRRSGMGAESTLLAHGVVTFDVGAGEEELRPVLEAIPPEGTARGYRMKVSGVESTELTMNLSGRRYVSIHRSEVGEEEREFLARPETRIVEAWVAHQYYFLSRFREGSRVTLIEPRTRRQVELTTGAWVDEQVRVGPGTVEARRVRFEGGEDTRIVWFDGQGRVVRLEIPASGLVSARQDLAG